MARYQMAVMVSINGVANVAMRGLAILSLAAGGINRLAVRVAVDSAKVGLYVVY